MTPRQARIGVDIYTGAVIVSVAVALAGLTWRMLGDAGSSPAAAPVMAHRATSDITRLVTLAPFGTFMAQPVAGGDGTIKLKAIFMSVPPESSVVLIAGSDGKVVSYGLGAAVGGGVIQAIQPEQIVLQTAGGLKTVPLFPAAGTAPVVAVIGTNAAPAIVAVPQPLPMAGIPGEADSPAMPTPPGTSRVSVSTGYRVGPSLSPQLLSTGLQPGDLIQRVNGTPVASNTNEREIFARAKAVGAAEIVLLRGGRQVTLTVPIP